MSSSFILLPQRRARKGGWAPCPEHQATRFAIVESRVKGTGKSKLVRQKTLAAFPTKAEAISFQLSIAHKGRNRRPPTNLAHPPRYGEMGVRGKGTIIAESLHKDQLP